MYQPPHHHRTIEIKIDKITHGKLIHGSLSIKGAFRISHATTKPIIPQLKNHNIMFPLNPNFFSPFSPQH
jgi:hypothetical protein